ncbi:MAG: hypothetical protein U9N04_04775 [Patescibacteria group bacterium]|nr:hypothetical protein [Patescibacteria group bacterium]
MKLKYGEGEWQILVERMIKNSPDGLSYDNLTRGLIEHEKKEGYIDPKLVDKIHKSVITITKSRSFKKRFCGERMKGDSTMTYKVKKGGGA